MEALVTSMNNTGEFLTNMMDAFSKDSQCDCPAAKIINFSKQTPTRRFLFLEAILLPFNAQYRAFWKLLVSSTNVGALVAQRHG